MKTCDGSCYFPANDGLCVNCRLLPPSPPQQRSHKVAKAQTLKKKAAAYAKESGTEELAVRTQRLLAYEAGYRAALADIKKLSFEWDAGDEVGYMIEELEKDE
jgi:hypothetical protein